MKAYEARRNAVTEQCRKLRKSTATSASAATIPYSHCPRLSESMLRLASLAICALTDPVLKNRLIMLSRAGVKGNRKLILVLIQERTLLLVSERIESSGFSLSLSSGSFSLAFSLVLLPSFSLSFWFSPSFLP